MRQLRSLFELLIPDNKDQRAFEETLADWRHGRSSASTPWMRLSAGAQGVVSLVRVAVSSAAWQVVDRNVWRPFTWTVVASMAASVLLSVRTLTVYMRVSANLAPMVILLLPSAFVAVFGITGSIGLGTRREEARPVVGQLVVATLVVFLLVGWVVPAANQGHRNSVFAFLSQAQTNTSLQSKLVPGPAEQSFPKVVLLSRSDSRSESAAATTRLGVIAALAITAPTFLLLGVAIRRRWIPRGSWRLAQVASGAAAIAAFVAGTFAAELLRAVNLTPLASGTELWLALLAAWLITVLAVRARGQDHPSQNATHPSASKA